MELVVRLNGTLQYLLRQRIAVLAPAAQRLKQGRGIGEPTRLRLDAHDHTLLVGLFGGEQCQIADVAEFLLPLRRGSDAGPQHVQLGNLSYDAGTRRVLIDGADLELTAREMAVLESLLRRPHALVSKEQLFESLYTWDSEANLSAVEVYVSRLRKKLEPAGVAIRMFRGLGYRLEAQNDTAPA
jgi:DNA-binding response OmpR family regulator